MSYSISKKEIVTYPPEHLRTFEVTPFEWIDNLNFTLDPHECLDDANAYVEIVKGLFTEAGWLGDGRIELMWIPPFMTHTDAFSPHSLGTTVWHVKQQEDGTSYILYPKELFAVNEKLLRDFSSS